MYPREYRYTTEHIWVAVQGSIATIGITNYAQAQMGDIVFVQLAQVGSRLKGGEAFGSVESVKAVTDLAAPLSGEVTAINAALIDSPELVNNDPHRTGWFVKLRMNNPAEASALLDASAYASYVAELSE